MQTAFLGIGGMRAQTCRLAGVCKLQRSITHDVRKQVRIASLSSE